MNRFWRHLRQSKLVQWALVYMAGAFAILQGLDIVAQRFAWPDVIERVLILCIFIGFFVTLLLAWYHGERGEQHVTGPELLLLAVLLAAGSAFLWMFGRAPPPPPATAGTRPVQVAAPGSIPAKSIAVLPFENLSADENNAYFAQGMQDLILTKLAGIGDLKVISRTSTLQYGSHPKNLKQIGRELGVATLLEGSVQKSGDQVLVSVQLINANTDDHIWAHNYQRTLNKVFGVEGEVAEKIADTLKAKLTPAETKRLTAVQSKSPEANDLFLRAYALELSSATNDQPVISVWKQAVSLYRQALALAPDFAQAHARLSFVEILLGRNDGEGEDARTMLADARTHAEQAMQLAPDLADSYLAMGAYENMVASDYDAALKAFDAGLKIRPNDAFLYLRRGGVLMSQGKYDDALEDAKHAWMLDPRNFYQNYSLGRAYMLTGRYGKAQRILKHALALRPNSVYAQASYSRCILYDTGDIDRALSVFTSDINVSKPLRARYLAYQRKFGAAIALLQSIPDTRNIIPTGDFDLELGNMYRLAGDKARARTYFTKALPIFHAQLSSQVHQMDVANTWLKIADAELGLGKTAAGITAIRTAQSAVRKSRDHPERIHILVGSARGYAQAGKANSAVAMITRALNKPGVGAYYSPVMLWIDPGWDPIRTTPAFQALEKKYARYRPATLPSPAKG